MTANAPLAALGLAAIHAELGVDPPSAPAADLVREIAGQIGSSRRRGPVENA